MKTHISKVQFLILFFLFDVLVMALAHVTVLNSYHGGEYSVGVSAFSANSQKKQLDVLETIFDAQTTYIDRVNLNITNLPQDRVGFLNIRLEHNGKVLYTGNKQFNAINPDQWFSIHLGVSLKLGEQYKLVVTSNGAKSLPSVYLSDDGITPIFTYTYKNDLRVIDKFLVSIYYGVLYLVCALFVLKYQGIFDWVKKLICNFGIRNWFLGPYAVVNSTVAAFVLYGSKLAVPDNASFYFFEISILLSGIWLENNFQKVKKQLFAGTKNKIIYTLLALYTSFSIVGNRCFIYPINMHVSFSGLLCFFGMALVVLPLVVLVTYVLGYGRKCKNAQSNGNLPWKVYFLCLGIIMFSSVCFMRAFNPAISSPDTLFCMSHALNDVHGMPDWHPPFYILWLKGILNIWSSVYAILLVQYAWFALVYLEGMRFLYRRGIKSAFIIFMTVLTVLNCGNMVQLTTIWKDIPYTISVLWTTILIAKFVLEDQRSKCLIYIELVIAIVCTAFMRQNGMVIFVILIPVLLYFFRKNWKMCGACTISIALAVSINFPLYSYLDIKSDAGDGKFVGLGQDMMAAYYNGGDLNDEAMHIVNVLSNRNIAEFGFNPYQAQYYTGQVFALNVPNFIIAYLDTYLRNPVLMTREIINRQDGVWNILAGQNGGMMEVNHIITMDGNSEWNSMVQTRENNFLTERLTEYTVRSVITPILNMMEWRAGIWTLFTVLGFSVCVFFKRNYKLWVLFTVSFAHILSLVLSLGWCDYRYYWPLALTSLFLILITLTIRTKEILYFNE